jgi:hypothetical protein
MELVVCVCRYCDHAAVWQIWVEGEMGRPEVAYACEVHAREQIRRAIILPEMMSEGVVITTGPQPR